MRVRDVTAEPHTTAVPENNSWMQLTMLCTTESGSNIGCYFLWQYGKYYIRGCPSLAKNTIKLPFVALCHLLDDCMLVQMDLQVVSLLACYKSFKVILLLK